MKTIKLELPFKGNPHIAKVQLNRPEVLNALSTELMQELVTCLLALEDDPDVRCIILTGNEKAFAAGADIAQMVAATPIDQIQDNRFRSWQMLSLMTKPIIAAVDGFALGGGCELAMSCDLILCSEDAKFGQPEIKIGTTPGAGGTQRLTRAIGKSKAMMMVLTGEMIDARTAYEWGLVAKVVPTHTLLQEAYELANVICDRAPVAVKLAKESVNKAFEMTLTQAMDFERRNFYLTFASMDQKEGMKAFLEKRNPDYKGN
jgi:enoyl-CoA hydratase